MKKIVLSIVGAVVIGIAAMNVNLALQGVNQSVSIVLRNIQAMTQENDSCNECQYRVVDRWCLDIDISCQDGDWSCSINTGQIQKCKRGSAACPSGLDRDC
jgi:hypothetical protein